MAPSPSPAIASMEAGEEEEAVEKEVETLVIAEDGDENDLTEI